MVSKNQLKLVRSLHQKKYRNDHGLFFVEGIKTVKELLRSQYHLHCLFATDAVIQHFMGYDTTVISTADLKRISALQKPSGVLAVFEISEPIAVDFDDWVLVLDAVRDPGNLGTVIRLCDWFGIRHLVCSKETVDCYNPKVLQATMGSISRVNVVYRDLEPFLVQSEATVYGAFMDGMPVHGAKLPDSGILVMGNEANGISTAIENGIRHKIGISQYGSKTTESLNVATATAILLHEIRRR